MLVHDNLTLKGRRGSGVKEEGKVSWEHQYSRVIPRRLRVGKTAELEENQRRVTQWQLHGLPGFKGLQCPPLPSLNDQESLGPVGIYCLLPGPEGTPIYSCGVCLIHITALFHLSGQVLCPASWIIAVILASTQCMVLTRLIAFLGPTWTLSSPAISPILLNPLLCELCSCFSVQPVFCDQPPNSPLTKTQS